MSDKTKHRRADWCFECGQPWPCPTERASRQSIKARCKHLVESSDKFCTRYAKPEFDGYCRSHWRMVTL